MSILYILIFILGLFSAILGSIVGLGGGVIIVPSFLYFSSVSEEFSYLTPQIIVGTSLVVVIVSSLSASISNHKDKLIDYKSGFIFFIASGPGSILGAYFNDLFKEHIFHIAFGILLIFILYFIIKDKKNNFNKENCQVLNEYTDKDGKVYTYGYRYSTAFTICFIIGVIQGMFGIGGGALIVPIMLLLFNFPIHRAIATTMFLILLSSTTGVISHIFMNNVDWKVLIWILPGAFIGGQIGAKISKKINDKHILLLLKITLTLLSIWSLWKGVSYFIF